MKPVSTNNLIIIVFKYVLVDNTGIQFLQIFLLEITLFEANSYLYLVRNIQEKKLKFFFLFHGNIIP